MRILVIILSIIGGLALLFVLAIAAIIMIGMKQIEPIMEEGTVYANETVRAIATDWDRQEFLERSSPEMMEVLTETMLNQFLSFARNELGNMTAFDDNAVCEIAQYQFDEEGESAFLACKATATFEKANGNMDLTIVRHDGLWQLVGFNIIADNVSESPIRTARAKQGFTTFEVSLSEKFVAIGNSRPVVISTGLSSSGAYMYRDLKQTLSVDQLLADEPQ
ncbi:hypothetical protein [Parvularcula sp. IMCC14364]|uniref:hypothetical protein n=1 Tax=Parvularcula sp. IMCC14364 TaxID=3067902 RepID=UPI00274075F6|nr:hypothetical protein [Parvularcula sp. IMCC14364]